MKVITSLAAALCAIVVAASPADPPTSILISGAQVADGTGKPLERLDVRIQGDTIAAVEGAGKLTPREGEKVVAGKGLVLAPGFIDPHNHSTGGLAKDPSAETQVSQGITTLVIGPDGDSPWPIGTYLQARRDAPGRGQCHDDDRPRDGAPASVMGEKDYKREATPEEVAAMAALVELGMRQGALGVSSGLEYDVGSYGSTDELVELCKAAAKHGGFYMTHIRDEADKSFEAFAEAIAISERSGAPLQISHIKLATVGVWNKAAQAVELFDKARAKGDDITADCSSPTRPGTPASTRWCPTSRYFDAASVERGLKDVAVPRGSP